SPALQLQLINELTALLQATGIPHWLFGGWVVDFLVGEITRPHSDIDLWIRHRDAPAFRELLVQHGYREGASPSGPELDARFCKLGQLLEVMFLHEGADGSTHWDHWRLPMDALETRDGMVGEIICPLVNPKVLIECKEACLQQATDPSERG